MLGHRINSIPPNLFIRLGNKILFGVSARDSLYDFNAQETISYPAALGPCAVEISCLYRAAKGNGMLKPAMKKRLCETSDNALKLWGEGHVVQRLQEVCLSAKGTPDSKILHMVGSMALDGMMYGRRSAAASCSLTRLRSTAFWSAVSGQSPARKNGPLSKTTISYATPCLTYIRECDTTCATFSLTSSRLVFLKDFGTNVGLETLDKRA